MSKNTTQNFIRIPKTEYAKLKRIQEYFGKFWVYFEHLRDIKKARNDVKAGRVVSQEKIFRDLDI